jgi:hypothetical protein
MGTPGALGTRYSYNLPVLVAPASLIKGWSYSPIRLWPFALPVCALRGTSGGATMTAPGGTGTPCKRTFHPCARRTGIYHGVGAPTGSPLGAPAFALSRSYLSVSGDIGAGKPPRPNPMG